MPNQIEDPFEVFTRLWNLVHQALRKQNLDIFLADLAHDAKEFEIRTQADFDKLIALAREWRGFGTGPDSLIGLFFKNSAETQHLPQKALDIPHLPVESLHIRSIERGLPDFRHCQPTSGATITWSGTACHAENRCEHGKLGAFLRDDQGAVWLLSANHVISCNGKCTTNRVTMNNCSEVSHETIAVGLHNCRDNDSNPNQADAAIARWDSETAPLTLIEGLPPLTGSIPLPQQAQGLIATKVGMPDHRTHGRVAYVDARVKVDMSDYLHAYSCVEFAHQILIEDLPQPKHPFCHPGDSGSLVVCETNGESQPLGLLIANNAEREGAEVSTARYSVVTPMGTVLKALSSATGRTFEIMT